MLYSIFVQCEWRKAGFAVEGPPFEKGSTESERPSCVCKEPFLFLTLLFAAPVSQMPLDFGMRIWVRMT